MKKLFLILFLLPIILFAQQTPGSFKIAKKSQKKPKDSLSWGIGGIYLDFTAYKAVTNIGDLFKKGTLPLEITNRFTGDIIVPFVITSKGMHTIFFCAKSGAVVNTVHSLAPSNIYIPSVPIKLGFYYIVSGVFFFADAGEEFFFKNNDRHLSQNNFFEFTGGIGTSIRFSKTSYNHIYLHVGYQRILNLNLLGYGIIFPIIL